eukprot:675659_1
MSRFCRLYTYVFIWHVSDTTYGLQVIGYKKVVEKSAKKGAGTPNQNNTKRRCMSTEPTQKHHTKRSHKVENKKLDKLCGEITHILDPAAEYVNILFCNE